MNSQKGFSLIEVVVSLVLVGIMAAVAGMVVLRGVEGYLLAKENLALVQKSQAALTRISLELHNMTVLSTVASSPFCINYKVRPGQGQSVAAVDRSLGVVGDEIKIVNSAVCPTGGTGDVLSDGISTLQMNYYKSSDAYSGNGSWTVADGLSQLYVVKLTMGMNHSFAGSAVTFSTFVNLRRNGTYNGPLNWNL